MIVQARNKFQHFLALDGEPLNNGYVYIGTSGLNPETNAIAIYYDTDMTKPIPQPLRTIGGYIVYNGSPVNVYTTADYSITVRDSDSSLVYSALSDNIDASQESALAAVDDATAIVVSAGYEVEAGRLTAQSYAEQTEDVFVDEYTSDGDGTYTATPTTDYSSLHWAAKAAASAASILTLAEGTYTPVVSSDPEGTATFPSPLRYTRVGKYVTVTGRMTYDANTTSLNRIYFNPPISTTFSNN